MHHLRALLPVAWYSLWLAKHNDVNDITLTSIFPFLSSRSFHTCFRAGVRAHTELPLTQINLLKSLVPVARTIIPTTFAYTTSTDTWQYCIYLWWIKKTEYCAASLRQEIQAGSSLLHVCRSYSIPLGELETWLPVSLVLETGYEMLCLHRFALNSIFDTLPSM